MDILQQAPEIRLRRKAHGSIMVYEPQPNFYPSQIFTQAKFMPSQIWFFDKIQTPIHQRPVSR
jgi:hypothetical protein